MIVHAKRNVALPHARWAAAQALREARASGTVALGDILSMDVTDPLLREEAARDQSFSAVLFREAIEARPAQGGAALWGVRDRQAQHGPLPPSLRHGLSPHAPYTVTEPLLRAAAWQARTTGQWLCIHAAETPQETELLLTGRGGLRQFLQPFLPADWQAPKMRPIPWLDRTGVLGPRTLLVHCNDITAQEARLIRRRGCRVVVCPGTHVFFDRGPFPLQLLLEQGVPVYLGTDSLASNESLDMAREVRLAQELAPRVPKETIAALAAAQRAADFGLPP